MVFTDLPFHREHNMGSQPILNLGIVIEFDLEFVDPKNPDRKRKVSGPYFASSHKLKFNSEKGLVQYLEMDPLRM